MTAQPTRRRVREPRRFDKTQLHLEAQGRQDHRDYAAHFFRWGWVSRQIKPGSKVLDVGCGQDLPLAHVLAGRLGAHRERYLGVDLNRIVKKPGFSWCEIRDEFNFVRDWKKLPTKFDYAVCFEVIEHMGPADGGRLLVGLRGLLRPGGTLYLSTPVFSGIAAANHIHEYTVPELKEKIEKAGFTVVHRYGTFGQLPKLKKVWTVAERGLHDSLREYYGNNVLSVVLALHHPDQASNNLWVCR